MYVKLHIEVHHVEVEISVNVNVDAHLYSPDPHTLILIELLVRAVFGLKIRRCAVQRVRDHTNHVGTLESATQRHSVCSQRGSRVESSQVTHSSEWVGEWVNGWVDTDICMKLSYEHTVDAKRRTLHGDEILEKELTKSCQRVESTY